ncbi:site-specific integrase [Actinocorallia longicatena]|uniref:Site-specific integrase n=1 Tax=Actinocorallia longicatena TaxID=111803 RepID=A0ABP6QAP3_9ACTN
MTKTALDVPEDEPNGRKPGDKRRARGDGGLRWSESRQRWIGEITVGYTPAGKRIVKTASDPEKTKAHKKLRDMLRKHEDGLTIDFSHYTVEQAARAWLDEGLGDVVPRTVHKLTSLCTTHVIPDLGKRKLRDLKAQEVQVWLRKKAATYSTRMLRELHACLNRMIRHAMAQEVVFRNVMDVVKVPRGKDGRPSRSLTFAQAVEVLRASETHRMHGYIVVSLLTGARTEEMRELRWDHVELKGQPAALGLPETPPHIAVWRSVRAGGDTKTRKSRRTLALPARAIEALKQQRTRQLREKRAAGDRWVDTGLVFTSTVGTALDASHVRRDFRNAIKDAKGLVAGAWTPRELRHSFVSLLSDRGGLASDQIAKLVGHTTTATTETVYRHQIRPVIQTGATVMDQIFGAQSGS